MSRPRRADAASRSRRAVRVLEHGPHHHRPRDLHALAPRSAAPRTGTRTGTRNRPTADCETFDGVRRVSGGRQAGSLRNSHERRNSAFSEMMGVFDRYRRIGYRPISICDHFGVAPDNSASICERLTAWVHFFERRRSSSAPGGYFCRPPSPLGAAQPGAHVRAAAARRPRHLHAVVDVHRRSPPRRTSRRWPSRGPSSSTPRTAPVSCTGSRWWRCR